MADTCPAWLAQLRAAVSRHIAAQRSSQAALAVHLGITQKHLSQLLTGQVNGSPEMLDRLAAAAGLRIAVVIGEGEPVPLPPRTSHGRRPGSKNKSSGRPGEPAGDPCDERVPLRVHEENEHGR